MLGRSGEVSTPRYSEGRDTNALLRELMGTGERPEWAQQAFERVEQYVSEGDLIAARAELEALAERLGPQDTTVLELQWELGDRELNGAAD